MELPVNFPPQLRQMLYLIERIEQEILAETDPVKRDALIVKKNAIQGNFDRLSAKYL